MSGLARGDSGAPNTSGLQLHLVIPERDIELALSIPAGETLAVLGPNGAGKSSIVQAVAGLLQPGAGALRLQGEALYPRRGAGASRWMPPHERGIGLLSQQPRLFPHLRVRENVAFGPRSRGVSAAESRERAESWLQRCGAAELAERWPRTLSGGQAQRVALARALATEPRLLLLDEPFSALDAAAVPELRMLLAELLEGVTALLVTHDPLDALALAQGCVVVEGGRVVQRGGVRKVLAHPATEFVRRLAFGVPL